MLLNLESSALFLHLKADNHVEIHILSGSFLIVLTAYIVLRVIRILHIFASVMPVRIVYAERNELLIHILLDEVATLKVHHRTSIASLVNDKERRNTCVLSHLSVISTESRSNMHDTSTVLCSNIVTRDYAESISLLDDNPIVFKSARLNPWHQLLIVNAYEVSTFTLPNDFHRDFIALFILCTLEVSAHSALSYDIDSLLISVRIIAFKGNIINLRTNAKRGV